MDDPREGRGWGWEWKGWAGMRLGFFWEEGVFLSPELLDGLICSDVFEVFMVGPVVVD
jgi:hypothetical protein